jgi:hypothetical protein
MSDTLPPTTQTYPRRPSTKAWLIIHILLPLLPLLIATFLRYVFDSKITLSTFKISDFSLTMGLIVAFARQSLLDAERTLDNDEKREEVAASAALMLFPLSFCLALFGAIESLEVILNTTTAKQFGDALLKAQISAIAVCIITAIWVILVQRSFKLKAKWS